MICGHQNVAISNTSAASTPGRTDLPHIQILRQIGPAGRRRAPQDHQCDESKITIEDLDVIGPASTGA